MKTPAIEIQHVTRSFGETAVLKDINLSIKQGEIFTLLGKNGAGKTTLIRILTTLLAADSGTVNVMGIPLAGNESRIRQQISLNFQATTVDDHLSGRANLQFIADLRRVHAVFIMGQRKFKCWLNSLKWPLLLIVKWGPIQVG
ncbi:ATP-binding cassette domain-containing protein [Lapidilactobacillus bayanensis]|uniref:ATP-binding cassette domain-containing protein n=1 Tax=Lapidilactobacillus bayanensis TaxID=2485998 RepID=UPI000F76E59C|nr:ATP-binding cassette domain-containing protein [Lapidilactobacillus bayanensis]